MAPVIVAVFNVTPDSFSGDGWLSTKNNEPQVVLAGNTLREAWEALFEQGLFHLFAAPKAPT